MAIDDLSPLSDVISLVRERRTGIPHEIAAFIVLQAAESVMNEPRVLEAATVLIDRQGGTRPALIARISSTQESARSLARLLQGLLRLADEQVPRDLTDIADGYANDPGDLGSLRERLISALLPLNRDASRRVLARFTRDLDRLERSVSAPLQIPMEESSPPPEPERSQINIVEPSFRLDSGPIDVDLDDEIAEQEPAEHSGVTSRSAFRTRRKILDLRVFFSFVGIVLAVSFVYMLWARSGQIGDTLSAKRAGSAEISLEPADARVLLFVGRSPLTVSDVPVNRPGYVIAFDDGTSVASAELGRSLRWKKDFGRYSSELALQMTRQDGSETAIPDPSFDTLANSNSDSGDSGEVRIVTNPADAKVYMYRGKGPQMRMSGLDPNKGYELLVYRAGYVSYRVIIGPSDWREENGKSVAKINVRLPKSDTF